MVNTAMVDLDIAAGSQVVQSLDEAGIPASVAVWMTTPEYEEGRLVLSSSALDQSHPIRAYQQIAEVLSEGPVRSLPAIRILRMRDPFIKSLRKIFGNAKSVEGMRLGGQTIGDQFVTDAYVYRVR